MKNNNNNKNNGFTERNLEKKIISMVGHDLKSPLNAIIGFSDLLTEKLKEKNSCPESLELARLIHEAGLQMYKQVDTMLTTYKIASGKETPRFEKILNIENEIAKVVRTFEMESKAKRISINVNLKNTIPAVEWDIERLRLHVFNNIISNALKFTNKGGEINIHIEKKGENICFAFEDTGGGIPDEKLNDIFNFYSQHSLEENNIKGHGVGLYNAKIFTERHSGRIWAENIYTKINSSVNSEEKPLGARFIVELPISAKILVTDFTI